MDRSYDGPLPWENDTKFIKRITKYNATIKMAAYKATLHDPLPGEGFNIGLAARQNLFSKQYHWTLYKLQRVPDRTYLCGM
ncbi:MAG: hypothetical protein ACOY3U_00050 [Bacillota bacterium]